eukprot:scaffold1912_cov167-Amphora_coffeaeformis.AAC.35
MLPSPSPGTHNRTTLEGIAHVDDLSEYGVFVGLASYAPLLRLIRLALFGWSLRRNTHGAISTLSRRLQRSVRDEASANLC